MSKLRKMGQPVPSPARRSSVHAIRVIGLLALVAAHAACSGSNPSYCDANSPCASGLICDIAGDYGPRNACVSPPDDAECRAMGDCTDSARPHCSDEGVCVACLTHADCPESAPQCTEAGECRGCNVAMGGDEACAQRDGAFPLCTAAGVCGECTGRDDCSAEAPVCSAEWTCVGCTDHSDCDSDLCDKVNRECVAASQVLYVAEDGSDAGLCEQGSPCATIGRALSVLEPTRNWIHLSAGTYDELVAVSGDTVNVAGSGNPTITGYADVAGGGTLTLQNVSLVGTGAAATGQAGVECAKGSYPSTVRISGGEIREYDGHGLIADDCIIELVDTRVADNAIVGFAGGGSSLQVGLVRVVVTENGGWGLNTEGADVSIEDSEFSANGSGGVLTDYGRLEIRRSRIVRNIGRGILVYSSDLVLSNSWIVENGGSAAVGGLEFETDGSAEQVLQFNTFANNTEGSATTEVQCQLDAGTRMDSTIVISDGTLSSNCFFDYSLGSSELTGKDNVIGTSAVFQSAGSGNYHLADGNDAIDGASPDATLDVDIDGDARPQGAGRDIGADEYVP